MGHQRYLDNQNIPLVVSNDLSTAWELNRAKDQISPIEQNLNIRLNVPDFWHISNQDYQDYINWVRNSIGMHLLCDAGIIQYCNASEVEFKINWELRMDWKNLNQNEMEAVSHLLQTDYSRHLYNEYFPFHHTIAAYNRVPMMIDRSLAITRFVVGVAPDTAVWIKAYPAAATIFDQKFSKKAMIGLDYVQALGYYQWWIRHSGKPKPVNKNTPLHQSMFPSKEQWEYLNSGKPIRMSWDIPYPKRFRYVIKFRKKD